uniref:ATP synthase F0 subunit 6 n=1 Tax=Amblyomma triste TaxID=251400 RepID=UPI00315C8661
MMNNLFSIFDPSTSLYFSFNWMTLSLWIFITPLPFWISSSLFMISWKIFLISIFQEIMNNMSYLKYKNMLFMISIFLIIFFSNVGGLLPFVFTPSSHLVFSMLFSFPFWISLIIFGIVNKFNMIMCHLVPMGSPILLSFFMVLIETISNIIRPITLSIRLTANMISGHLLIHLLSSIMMKLPYYFLMLLIMMMLLILETAVAIIQSFVFITLISLYINEI